MLAERVRFERSCWVVWGGDLVFSVGGGFVSEGGKDECLTKAASPPCNLGELRS